jgi:hypothetical protein
MAVVNKLKELSKVTLPVREVQTVPTAASSPPAAPVTTAAGAELTVDQFLSLLEHAKRVA